MIFLEHRLCIYSTSCSYQIASAIKETKLREGTSCMAWNLFGRDLVVVFTFISSAIFNFHSLLSVVLLLICTCAYIRSIFPTLLDRNKTGFLGFFWKCARIGERKSPYVSLCCLAMAVSLLFW